MMNNNIEFKQFGSSEELAKSFSDELASILQNEINEKQKATLLVSGGSTPKLFFKYLSKQDIDWQKVYIGLVDDRWLEDSHKDSNAKLVKENILQDNAKDAKFIPMYIEGKSADESEFECSKIYKEYFESCDVLILGMGEDAHTASIFPELDNFKEAVDLDRDGFCISTKPKYAPYDRMSLTLKSILESKNIYLHIQGVNKKSVYDKALQSKDLPISKVLNNEIKDIKVYYNE